MRVGFIGTYDVDQPRTRVIIEGLRLTGVEVVERRLPLWADTAQKIQAARKPAALASQVVRFARTYTQLIGEARRLEDCDAVIYPHLGQLDLIATSRVFRRRGIPIIWDALISLFDSAAGDRQLLNQRSLMASGLAFLDRTAGRLADFVLADTIQNAGFWRNRFGIAQAKLRVVPVGAEDVYVRAGDSRDAGRRQAGPFDVLFFGKYIPLHGVATILAAATELRDSPEIQLTMVGTGQERPMADEMARKLRLSNVRFVDWVPYDRLPGRIAAADVCLGIFGTGDKAQRVVPNKAYQALACGCPLITGDTPAGRELLVRGGLAGARLVPPGDHRALAIAIEQLCREPERRAGFGTSGRVLFDRYYRSDLAGRQVAAIVDEAGRGQGQVSP